MLSVLVLNRLEEALGVPVHYLMLLICILRRATSQEVVSLAKLLGWEAIGAGLNWTTENPRYLSKKILDTWARYTCLLLVIYWDLFVKGHQCGNSWVIYTQSLREPSLCFHRNLFFYKINLISSLNTFTKQLFFF